MGQSEKKLRTCLFFVIGCAVFIGVLYYFFECEDQKEIEKGVLITGNRIGMTEQWKQ